eukprot:Phypoly_transcript_16128.p1 GENE.Phypoly_transcript_16128~~Phypoly_transcript_16128.p1  ORF type:complete len:185 (+),score=28.93 Phypoly_transcript_16128:102-656(+)
MVPLIETPLVLPSDGAIITFKHIKPKIQYIVNLPVNIPPHISEIYFDNKYNLSLQDIFLPDSITHLHFGNSFDKQVNGYLPPSLTHLSFGDSFKSPVDFWAQKQLTHLTFGKKFNHPVDNLPTSLTHLEIWCKNLTSLLPTHPQVCNQSFLECILLNPSIACHTLSTHCPHIPQQPSILSHHTL